MVGGRDYGLSQFNRATQALRQPGSCFKPFVYLAGFESSELTPSTVLEDEPIELKSGGTTWRPVNYDKQFRGPVSARYALEKSLNVPTVRAARMVGLQDVARMAERCGIDREFRPLPALARAFSQTEGDARARARVLGDSVQMQRLIEQIERVAHIPRPLLIVGERGTVLKSDDGGEKWTQVLPPVDRRKG